jgi:hypothetical protein
LTARCLITTVSRVRRLTLLVSVAAAVAAITAASASAYPIFSLSVSAYGLSYTGTISASAYASYSDYSCTPSYACDRNVIVQFRLYRGFGAYGPLVGTSSGQTGQYGSSVRATFTVPPCRFIPRYSRVSYTVAALGVAPNGQQKTSTSYVSISSCA